MVGSAIHRQLLAAGHSSVITRASNELDLRNAGSTYSFFQQERPEFVFLAAAKVGGIVANDTRRGEFIFDNLSIQNNVIDASYRNGVEKLLFLGSSCIYPKMCPQPIKEEYLLTGALEPTNEPYAIAKIAGIKLCQAYRDQYGFNAISLMPTNLYGPNDNFDLTSSHVLPALMRKVHEAKLRGDEQFVVWGTGSPKREFLHCDDLADAAVKFMNDYDGPDIVNIGTGLDCSIAELARTIMRVVGYEGEIAFDSTKPDGTPRKLLDVSRAEALGWKAKTALEEGLRTTYDWFCQHAAAAV
jgi:GDP-L-fucose synthase